MKITCLASGSSGNCYVLQHNEETILIECGLEYRDITYKLYELDIVVKDINALVITHGHKDHSLAIEDFIVRGILTVAPKSVIKGNYDNCRYAENGTKIQLTENISLRAFCVNHDCDALGYIFHSKDTKETLLFINDTYYFDFQYKEYNYDYICIECNHNRKIVDELKKQKPEMAAKYERQTEYHMSLAALKLFLSKMNLNRTKAIYLMHQSYECADPDICKKVISKIYPNSKVYICGRNGGLY